MGEHLDRQLAAVMVADMVGFTALMQADEQLALRARARYASVLNAQHEAFGGRIVQYYGDGALTIFPNSLDAVRCAIEIQKELRQPPDVPVRIGIHVGTVIVETTGMIGDAVNIASRIESFGGAGGGLVSDRFTIRSGSAATWVREPGEVQAQERRPPVRDLRGLRRWFGGPGRGPPDGQG
jgi:class 3 adenylate cyclase